MMSWHVMSWTGTPLPVTSPLRAVGGGGSGGNRSTSAATALPAWGHQGGLAGLTVPLAEPHLDNRYPSGSNALA